MKSTVAAVCLLFFFITRTISLRSACAQRRATQLVSSKLPPTQVIQQLASSPRFSVTHHTTQTSSPSKMMAAICRGVALGALLGLLGASQAANAQTQSQGQVQVDRYEDENYEVEQSEGKAGLGSPGNSIAEDFVGFGFKLLGTPTGAAQSTEPEGQGAFATYRTINPRAKKSQKQIQLAPGPVQAPAAEAVTGCDEAANLCLERPS